MNTVRRLVAIAYFVEVGLLLVLVPWTPFLHQNYFVQAWPVLRDVVDNGFVKGAVSGLGLLNLWAGGVEVMALLGGRRDPENP